MEGKGAVQTSSPCSSVHGLAGVVEDLRLHAEAEALDLAVVDRQERAAEPKHAMMSVPPEIDASCTSGPSRRDVVDTAPALSGEPVERIVRRTASHVARAGRNARLLERARKRGLVPKIVTRFVRGHAPEDAGSGCSGAPSNSTIVAPVASALASQFHITQPQVVK